MGENQFGARSELITFLAGYSVGERIEERDMARFGDWVGLKPMEVRALFAALARADLVEEDALGIGYRAVRDPILNEFLQVWVRMERESVPAGMLVSEWQERYQRLVRKMHEYKGYVAERWIELMMMKWREEKVEGKEYFGVEGKVRLPRFDWVGKWELVTRDGKRAEPDVIGRFFGGAWVVESKYWEQKVSLKEVHELEAMGKIGKEALGEEEVKLWYFSKRGFTDEAMEYMRKQGILHTNEEQLNRLLRRYGLRELPKM